MDVGAALPLFPLGTVLFPGAPLSLLVFEQRYLDLVAHLLTLPEDRRTFGVVAIRDGYEVGELAVHSAHRVGCEAVVEQLQQRPDGRYDLEAVGRRRFHVEGMDDAQSYLVGDVAWLNEPDGDELDDVRARALYAFEGYRAQLGELRGAQLDVSGMPDQPRPLSYALSAGGLFMMNDRQGLLEEESTSARLVRLTRLLREETKAMAALPSLPATEVVRTGWSPN